MIARDDGMIGIHFMRLGMLALALGHLVGGAPTGRRVGHPVRMEPTSESTVGVP